MVPDRPSGVDVVDDGRAKGGDGGRGGRRAGRWIGRVGGPGSYVLLVCTWSVHKATSFAGPWSSALPINPTPLPLDPVAHWEDPYIYQDLRGHWHLLSHVYNTAPFATTGLNYISGHGFSEDGLHWSEASEPSAASAVC